MKVLITEKQLKKLLKDTLDQEIDEQEATPEDAQPKTGESQQKSVSQGYPEVTTWEDIVGSKLTRGPANQIKNTKWSDTVGSKISRGPANQLK